MRVLIVKSSSMGDILHTLPALTDAKKAYPHAIFDWVCEEAFCEIPRWHSGVNRVIPVAFRRWRKQKVHAWQQGEIQKFLKDLRQKHYDVIIDAQGLLKSVAMVMAARGTKRVGLSWKSIREGLASLFYHKRIEVNWNQHVVQGLRDFFAEGLGYAKPQYPPQYGIDRSRFAVSQLEGPYVVFLHGTAWESKHWPEPYWLALAQKVAQAGFKIQLLWGSEAELLRAKRIAATTPAAFVIGNRLSLSEAASVLNAAWGIVSLDTGLGHLAGALGVPAVALYGPTDPSYSSTLGENQSYLSAEFPCSPCMKRTCSITGEKPIDPPCFSTVPPDKVWERLLWQVNQASQTPSETEGPCLPQSKNPNEVERMKVDA